MKMLTALLILGISPLPAVVLVIDDFTRGVEEHRSAVDGLGTPRETADDSIFGGYRRSLANGFVRFRLVDGNVVAGDSSGFASVSVAGGFLNTTKTALTGVASMGYLGRSFTLGDRIGDLSLDVSGGPSSLASPVLFLDHVAHSTDQIVSFSLTSAIDTYSWFDISIAAGATTTVVDLSSLPPAGIGFLGAVDFSNVEELSIGIINGDPAASVVIDRFGFVPEPSTFSLLTIGGWAVLSRRKRGVEQNVDLNI